MRSAVLLHGTVVPFGDSEGPVNVTELKRRASFLGPMIAAATACVFSAAGSARAATRFVFATFKSDAVADEKLFTYDSNDGLNFSLLSSTGYSGPSPGTLRDPSIIKYFDGKYYVVHTNPQGAGCCGNEDHFSIASSTDLVHWTQLTTVKGAIPNLAHVWAPEWFVEGATVNIIANMDTGAADFQQYLFTARDTSLTSWSGPVLMGIAKNHIDTFLLKVGTTYHAFVKSEATRYLEHATADKLTGPWTLIGKDDWAGWGSGMEGPSIVKLDSGTWRLFIDPQQSTFFYSDSKDLMTWSKPVPLPGVAAVVRHGTVIPDVMVGGAMGGAGGAAGFPSSGASGTGEAAGFPSSGASGAGGSGSVAGAGGSASPGSNAGLGGSAGTPGAFELGGSVNAEGPGVAGASSAVAEAGAGTGGGASTPPTSTPTEAGCNCRASRSSTGSSTQWLSALLLAGFALGARRRRTVSRPQRIRTPPGFQ